MRIEPPRRASHTYVQRLVAPPDAVFPLLCPVREAEWVRGWDPRLVITGSGVAEPGCVFFTGPEAAESIWVVTTHRPPERVEFVKVTSGETVCRIAIVLEPDGNEGEGTLAEVTYEYTAIGEAGEDVVARFTEEHYLEFMEEWESSLNHFLETGKKLRR